MTFQSYRRQVPEKSATSWLINTLHDTEYSDNNSDVQENGTRRVIIFTSVPPPDYVLSQYNPLNINETHFIITPTLT
jgi:predicted hydrolase (HD superfamily)